MQQSIELEYWVIDDRGRLTAPGDLVELPGAEREFIAPMLEIKTTPCDTTAQLERDLYDRLSTVLHHAKQQDKQLVPLATPLNEESINDLQSDRTRIQDRVIGENFEYVRHCAGTHIHVEQLPGNAIDQLNVLTALDPALALVNSSPFFDGERIASGARSKLYRWQAYEMLPHQGQLWRYAESRTEWAKRVDRRYVEFVTEAITAGFDKEYVESCFDPEGAVWTPVKLRSEFSTVEWRSPDTTLPSQALRLADDVSSVVERVDETEVRIDGTRGKVTDEEILLPSFDALRDRVVSAIRKGLESNEVRSYLDRMGVEAADYDPLTTEFEGQSELSKAQVRDHRLEYADLLAQDIQHSKPIST